MKQPKAGLSAATLVLFAGLLWEARSWDAHSEARAAGQPGSSAPELQLAAATKKKDVPASKAPSKDAKSAPPAKADAKGQNNAKAHDKNTPDKESKAHGNGEDKDAKPAADASATSPIPAEPSAKGEADAKAADPDVWPASEIEAAKARCDKILAEIEVAAVPAPPMKKGECGAAAPVQLTSVGKKPEVAISPPAVVTCEMAEAIHNWVKDDLQPLARKHFGADVVRIENISDYSCRNALGRTTTRLSEHGRANALDIRRFVTAKGDTADLLEDWGITERELAEIAAAKAAAEKAAAEKAAAEAAERKNQQAGKAGDAKKSDANKDDAKPQLDSKSGPTAPATAEAKVGAPAGGVVKGTIVDGVPKLRVTLPGADKSAGRTANLGHAPNSLGGPKLKGPDKDKGSKRASIPAPALPPPPQSAKQKFLHEAHVAGCRIFGTILGPEANAAHRNHFHIDLAERRHRNFCE